MQFLHCAAHLPIIANYRESATWQASPICRLKRKLSLTLKGTVQLQSNNFYIVLRTISTLSCAPSFTCKICQVPVTPLPGKVSPNCRCYVSLPKRNHLSKKSLDSSHVCSLHLSPHPGILPPQVAKQLHKNAQLNLQNIYFNQPSLNLCTSLPHCLNIYKTL